ncbi:hypothetical protein [Pseudomonas sp. UMAB-40]|uniref:hypothetical protein n=1 Tax=Pseudomonas sp. UMAB-40 TaxID=1365407 RepID=UPI001C55E500|nr:hypothetical protein [Pseudomonas sp. UMAB-40]
MSGELNSKNSTTGSFVVRVDGKEPLKQDYKSFDVKEGSVEIWVLEGVGGPMAPRTHLLLGFQGDYPSGRHDATKLLKVEYKEWSDMHGFEYKAKSGWVEVSSTPSPRRITGKFEMVVESSSSGAPPEKRVSGDFDLTNE